MNTYQMPEVSRHHKLKGLRRTRAVSSDHRVPRHDSTDGGGVGIETFRRNLQHL